MKKSIALALVVVLFLGAAASGCLGGGGSSEYQTSNGSQEESQTLSGSQETSSGSNSQVTATWQTPWDAYGSVKLGGNDYYITYIKYVYTAGYNNGAKYSFEVEKERGYVNAHVYASENGQKKDLGTYRVFAYHGRLTPINNKSIGPIEYWVLVKERTKDTDAYFLAPSLNFGALVGGNVVEIEIVSGSSRFFWSNPAAVGKYSEMPYQEGDLNDVLSSVDSSLATIWLAVMTSTIWTGLEDRDLTKPDQYDWSGMGISYHYKVSPDGTVTFDGKSFKTANVEWSYSIGGVSAKGKGKIAPALPIPVSFEGIFANLAQGLKTWSEFELKDIKLSESFGVLSYGALTPTQTQSQTETQTQTQTETETQTGGSTSSSNNWKLAWDASEPITINGQKYLVREVTFEAEYHNSNGAQAQMTIIKGYHEGKLNGEEVYVLYAIVNLSGKIYNYTLYVSPDDLEEYTSGPLWLPSVGEMMNMGMYIKEEVTGPNCHFTMDESGNFEGDQNCGYIDDAYRTYNNIWAQGAFAGGVYGDVVYVYTLTGNGQGYTVEPDGHFSFAGMDFRAYRVTWSGIVQNSDVKANGETLVVPELPFPVEVTASLTIPGGEGIYVHMKLADLKMKPAG